MGVTGWDWIWIGIAVLLDLGHYTYSAYGNREQIPGMSSGQSAAHPTRPTTGDPARPGPATKWRRYD